MAVKLTVRLGGDEFITEGALLTEAKPLLGEFYQQRDQIQGARISTLTARLMKAADGLAAVVKAHPL